MAEEKELDDVLPNTLHELGALALADLEKIEKTPGYKIVLSVWHQPHYAGYPKVYGVNLEDQPCAVCVAGAMLNQAYKLSPQDTVRGLRWGDQSSLASISPTGETWRFPLTVTAKLAAVDDLRAGCVGLAHKHLYGQPLPAELIAEFYEPGTVIQRFKALSYRDDPEAFKQRFQEVIDACRRCRI